MTFESNSFVVPLPCYMHIRQLFCCAENRWHKMPMEGNGFIFWVSILSTSQSLSSTDSSYCSCSSQFVNKSADEDLDWASFEDQNLKILIRNAVPTNMDRAAHSPDPKDQGLSNARYNASIWIPGQTRWTWKEVRPYPSYKRNAKHRTWTSNTFRVQIFKLGSGSYWRPVCYSGARTNKWCQLTMSPSFVHAVRK